MALLDHSTSSPEGLANASEIFSSLESHDADERAAIAGLIASKATTQYSQIESYLENLTLISDLTAGVDVATLEATGIPTAPQPSSAASVSKKRAAPTEDKPKKKRIRKNRLPKDYEEGKQLDPERWLPLRDRSSYRPKGKKGKKKAMESTQGGVVKDDHESLELVGGAGAVKVEKAGGGSGGVAKAKKKKGKK